MSRGLGNVQRKILLILLGGVALGVSGSPRRYFKILRYISKEWKDINRNELKRSVKSLYKQNFIEDIKNESGATKLVLTGKGKELAIKHNFKALKIKIPKKWDKKWRLVIFDVPEVNKKKRDMFRFRLKNLNFYEFQKSVFVCPFDCKREIDYMVKFYHIKKFVHFVIADSIDNDLVLKDKFNLK